MPQQQSAIKLGLRDFKLSGVALEGAAKQRYAEISARLSQLASDFSNHVLDATQAYFKPLTEAQRKHQTAALLCLNNTVSSVNSSNLSLHWIFHRTWQS